MGMRLFQGQFQAIAVRMEVKAVVTEQIFTPGPPGYAQVQRQTVD